MKGFTIAFKTLAALGVVGVLGVGYVQLVNVGAKLTRNERVEQPDSTQVTKLVREDAIGYMTSEQCLPSLTWPAIFPVVNDNDFAPSRREKLMVALSTVGLVERTMVYQDEVAQGQRYRKPYFIYTLTKAAKPFVRATHSSQSAEKEFGSSKSTLCFGKLALSDIGNVQTAGGSSGQSSDATLVAAVSSAWKDEAGVAYADVKYALVTDQTPEKWKASILAATGRPDSSAIEPALDTIAWSSGYRDSLETVRIKMSEKGFWKIDGDID